MRLQAQDGRQTPEPKNRQGRLGASCYKHPTHAGLGLQQRPLLCTHDDPATQECPRLTFQTRFAPPAQPGPCRPRPTAMGTLPSGTPDPRKSQEAPPPRGAWPDLGACARSCTTRPVTLERWSVSCLLQDMLWTLMM